MAGIIAVAGAIAKGGFFISKTVDI